MPETDYVKELFETPLTQPSSTEVDYVKELFDSSPKVERHYEETEEIDTRSSRPRVKFTGKGGSGASFYSHLKQGTVSDPMTKVKIYAADRFPNLSDEDRMSRYKHQNGEIIFKDDDGKWYSESPDLFHHKLKKFLATGAANAPAIIMGTAGEFLGGPGAAFVGAAGGEGIRRSIGALAFDEPQTAKGNVSDMLLEGSLGGLGSIPGRGVKRGIRRVGASFGGRKGYRVGKAAGIELPTIDFRKAAQHQKFVKEKFGVDLFSGQTTESRRLLDKINLYGDLPQTSDMIQSAKKMQDDQAFNAVETFWDDLHEAVPTDVVGEGLSKAAETSIQREVGKRMAKAKPYYDRAFKSKTKVDINPHIQEIDELIEAWPLHSAERKKLQGFRSLLFKEIKIGDDVYQVAEDRIKHLDRIKKSVDSYLKPKLGDANVTKEVKRDIRRVKNNILADIDKSNPDYAKARQIWKDDTKSIERLTNKTKLQKLANLEGDEQWATASKKLFSNVNNNPQIMTKIRDRIIKEDPELWDSVMRTHLESMFDMTKGSAELGAADSAKRFNAFWRNTVGDKKQNDLIKAAYGGENTMGYKNFYNFADMLRRVGLVVRKESTTATRQEMIKQAEPSLAVKLVKASFYPLITRRKILYDKFRVLQTERGRRLMAETLLDPRATEHLLKIRKLGPMSEKGLEATSTFLSLVAGGEFIRGEQFDFLREDKQH